MNKGIERFSLNSYRGLLEADSIPPTDQLVKIITDTPNIVDVPPKSAYNVLSEIIEVRAQLDTCEDSIIDFYNNIVSSASFKFHPTDKVEVIVSVAEAILRKDLLISRELLQISSPTLIAFTTHHSVQKLAKLISTGELIKEKEQQAYTVIAYLTALQNMTFFIKSTTNAMLLDIKNEEIQKLGFGLWIQTQDREELEKMQTYILFSKGVAPMIGKTSGGSDFLALPTMSKQKDD